MAIASVHEIIKVSKRLAAEHWYFTGLALVIIAVSVAGFAPSLTHPAARRAPVSLLAAAHGFVFLTWQILFLIQSGLVATHRIAWHRRLGAFAALVMILMLPLGVANVISMGRRGFDLSGDLKVMPHPTPGYIDPIAGMLFPLTDLIMFAILAGTALAFRRRREIHKRLMLFANIMLMPAALQHLIGHSPRLASINAPIIMIPIGLFLLSAVARDYLASRRVHALTWILAITLFASGPFRAFVIGPSLTWHRIGAWLIGN